ncbi:MAG: hypothetical protein K9L86_02240 [Candidatus Omnitrophica bacterium]|nr:hypothetical protein [Candidatus Omnitrophota bacterium]
MSNKPWTTKLSVLDKRVSAFSEGYRQNIALLGNDAEETAYLLQNYRELKNHNQFVYIHISTVYAGKKELLKATILSLLSSYADKTDSLDNLIYAVSSVLPLTTENIKNCLKKNSICFLDILEIINAFINESGSRCVFIIEEFLGVVALFENFYSDFSKFIILQQNCMIILAASSERLAQKVLSDELNLLFGNFEIISLSEESFLNSFVYLKNLLPSITPSPFFLSFFANFLGSNCIYYDSLAKSIKDKYQSDNEESAIISILEEFLYRQETYCFQRFIKNIDKLKFIFKDFQPTLKLLTSISQGYMRKKELLALGFCDSKELNSKLQKLIDSNYIVNFGNIYKIRDSLFSFWLSHVFELHSLFPLHNPKQRKQFFKEKLKKEISLFKDEFYTDSLKKVLQLFASFKNDTLKLGKTRYSLPTIERTKTISYPQRDFHFIIGEGKEIIFAGIKGKDADDIDMTDFIEKGANIRGKGVKKIFISLGTLPSATRLIAKNNKIAIWDLQELNKLLHIYNKPVFSQ